MSVKTWFIDSATFSLITIQFRMGGEQAFPLLRSTRQVFVVVARANTTDRKLGIRTTNKPTNRLLTQNKNRREAIIFQESSLPRPPARHNSISQLLRCRFFFRESLQFQKLNAVCGLLTNLIFRFYMQNLFSTAIPCPGAEASQGPCKQVRD